MAKFVTLYARLDSPEAVTKYWADYRAHAARRQQITRKETPMPLSKSASDIAWHAVYVEARKLVDAGKAPDVPAAVDQLRDKSHPAYVTYLAVSEHAGLPPTPPADPTVVKRQRTRDEVQKRVAPLVNAGMTETDAQHAVFKADREAGGDLYQRYREASYARGPVAPPAPADTASVPEAPVYAQVRKAALALKQADVWGQYAGKSEGELMQAVFDKDPALYAAYRAEVVR